MTDLMLFRVNAARSRCVASVLAQSVALLAVLITSAGPAAASECAPTQAPTFTVTFPKVVNPPNPHGWDLPVVWGPLNGQVPSSDSIEVPNGRPIYALIVSGYSQNSHLDQLMTYSFARHLMAQGAYVHYAWWNNLLAPYMERPLHHAQSHPGISSDMLANFTTASAAEGKAMPGENYQFLADAKLFLSAIRENNPEAVIIIVGHSMGGHSVAQLANETTVLIDLLAPIDPVANRTYPWAAPSFQSEPHYNWTRYRATRESFNGYRSMTWSGGLGGECIPTGPWLQSWGEASSGSTHLLCLGQVHVHGAPHMTLQSNVINLYHRWQEEALFPFDFGDVRLFNPGFAFPAGGSQIQTVLGMQSSGSESGGWPLGGLASQGCCPGSNGVHWSADGHGEIIGGRGPIVGSGVQPLGYRVKTSPQCGSSCSGLSWPARTLSSSEVWGNPSSGTRVALLKALETLPLAQAWAHQPYNPSLCRISAPLISRFNTMNKPAVADTGGDQTVSCSGCSFATVTLDASASFDPEGSPLTYAWSWSFGSASTPVVSVQMPVGTHCVMLEVKDPVGHISRDYASITVVDDASSIQPFTRTASLWTRTVQSEKAFAFDQFFPGLPNALGCLQSPPTAPAVIALSGGTVTIRGTQAGTPYCVITDGSTAPAVSDAQISTGAVVEAVFEPSITALYTYYGSLAIGHTASMTLFGNGDEPLGTITSLPSTHASHATGQGFTSSVPVRRIEFSSTEPGTVLLGAFTSLLAGEQSLGAVTLPGYAGPAGATVQFDMAVVFGHGCPADFDGDGLVNGSDLGHLLGAWGVHDGDADLTGDGLVNGADLGTLLGAWGMCP